MRTLDRVLSGADVKCIKSAAGNWLKTCRQRLARTLALHGEKTGVCTVRHSDVPYSPRDGSSTCLIDKRRPTVRLPTDRARRLALPFCLRSGYAGVLLLGVFVCAAAFSKADAATNSTTESIWLDPMVVTTRGYPALVSATPGSVGLVLSNEIEGRSIVSVPDAFVLVPGVYRESDSPWGSDVNIRGLGRSAVVMRIDGARVNTATDINGRFGFVDPWNVERIEIIKGPISSLYGSGSIGGVVNVITRTGHFSPTPVPGAGICLGGESNPEGMDARAYGEFGSSNIYFYVFQSLRDHDSYKDGNGDTVENSQFRDRHTSFRAGYRPVDLYTAELNVQYYVGENIGIPGSGEAPLPAAADVTYPSTRRCLVNLRNTFDPDNDIFRQSVLDLYYQYIDRRVRIDNFPAASPLVSVEPQADHDTFGSRWLNVLSLERQNIVAGFDVWQRHLHDSRRTKLLKTGAEVTDQPLPEARSTSGGIFVEDDVFVCPVFSVNAGARFDLINVSNHATPQYDEDNVSDHSWNMHLGCVLDLTDCLSMRLVGARGYRAPTLEERYQYIQLGGGVTRWGDPDLDPEKSLMFEYSLNWQDDTKQASLAVFINELDDMIGEQVVSPDRIVNANIDEARIYGVEASVRWSLLKWLDVFGNLAYAEGRDTGNDEYLPYIAPLNGLAGVESSMSNGVYTRIETVMTARQGKVPEDVNPAPGWFSMDVCLGYRKLAGKWSHNVYVGASNLLDRNYRNYLTTSRGAVYNEPGRSFYAGYEVLF